MSKLIKFCRRNKILNELTNWALHIENSIFIRSDEISDEDKEVYSEYQIDSEFSDSIEWGDGSINTIQKLREKLKNIVLTD